MIELTSVSLQLGAIQVLRDITFRLQSGEITVLMGANGTGKTSLLKLICGEWSPTTGDVRLHGRSVSRWLPQQRAQTMAVLPQLSTLDFPLSVDEVVMLGRTPHGTGIKRDKDIVAQALVAVDCQHLKARIYTQLSGGEKQRVQFARVLAQIWECDHGEAPVLILDEPAASLDIEHQLAMLKTVRWFAERGAIVMMVLHDINLAASCADQMVLLQSGSIATIGSPADVIKASTIEQIFSIKAEVITLEHRDVPLVIPR